MRRFAAFFAILTTCVASAKADVPVERKPLTTVYKHNQWPLSIVEFRDNVTELPTGYAYRYAWPKKVSDGYSLHDTAGNVLGQASFSGSGLRASTFCGANIDVTGPEVEALGSIVGTCSTLHRGLFTINDKLGDPIAVALLSYDGNQLVVMDAATQRKVLATLNHTALVVNEPPHWVIQHSDQKTLSPVLLNALVSYVVDYESYLAPYGMITGVGVWLTEWKAMLETLTFWRGIFG